MSTVAADRWRCRRCFASLAMALDHVGCGAAHVMCGGTWDHPRNRCVLSGRNISRANAVRV